LFLDLNNLDFQEDWFALERQEALAVFATLHKIQQLRWDMILSRTGPSGQRIYVSLSA
jgi:hypothetical protein